MFQNAGGLATSFIDEMDYETFLLDFKTQSVVIHPLLILGEAVKRLSSEYRDSHSDVPQKLMAGMRGKLIHGHGSVDIDQVWQTVELEIPETLSRIND